MVDGSPKFTMLHFSLSDGPFIFTKIQKALEEAGNLYIYLLDDGAGADSDFSEAQRVWT